MPSKKVVRNSYKRILAKVGLTEDDIPVLFPAEWKRVTGYNFGNCWGRAYNENKRLIGLGKIRKLSLAQIKETIWHELGHHLFESKPHWWVFVYIINS